MRKFGGKEDKTFWTDKPIQEGHPDYKMTPVFALTFAEFNHRFRYSKKHRYIRSVNDLDGFGPDYFTDFEIIGNAFKNEKSRDAYDEFKIQFPKLFKK